MNISAELIFICYLPSLRKQPSWYFTTVETVHTKVYGSKKMKQITLSTTPHENEDILLLHLPTIVLSMVHSNTAAPGGGTQQTRPGMWTSSPGSLCIEPHHIFQNHLCWGLHQLQFCPVNSVAVRNQLKGSKAKCTLKVFANIYVSCEENQALFAFFLVTSSQANVSYLYLHGSFCDNSYYSIKRKRKKIHFLNVQPWKISAIYFSRHSLQQKSYCHDHQNK